MSARGIVEPHGEAAGWRARRGKADATLAAIPGIMLTAKGQARAVAAGLGAGAVDHVVKPFSLKEFNVRVDKALQGTSRAEA